jgi:hypothetical protein
MAWARRSAPLAGRPAGQRHRYDQRARRQVLAGREHRPDQGLGPGHDVGPPDDQGQQEQPRVQLAGVSGAAVRVWRLFSGRQVA